MSQPGSPVRRGLKIVIWIVVGIAVLFAALLAASIALWVGFEVR